ncbi:hypothetical protein MUP77_25810 [Candidatus Bathyarchaeota archaeon]|nr:hypothetical protein [Candidatus Bathyarchaeota archaeon]
MPAVYSPSFAQETIVLARPINTVTTVEAYGSADGYVAPDTWFGIDETIMIGGAVVATNKANLSMVSIRIFVNGTQVGTAPLSYDPATGNNYYQYTLGALAEGSYLIEARFSRLRVP